MSNTNNDDVNVVPEGFEGVSRLSDIYCKKYPGHENFFSVRDYNGEGLPQNYQNDPELIQHVKNQAEITVLLKINRTCKHRSEYSPDYPFSDTTSGCTGITGSGWLDRVSDYEREQPCPCSECKKSGSPHNGWAEIEICTAAHVVFDEDEGSRTDCYFFFDTEEIDYKSCPKLSNAVNVMISAAADTSLLTIICHDKDFSDRLRSIYRTYIEDSRGLRRKYNGPYPTPKDELGLLQKCLKKVMKAQKRLISKITDIKDGDKLMLTLESLGDDNREAYELDDLIIKLAATIEAMDEDRFESQYECYRNMIKQFENKVQHARHMLGEKDIPPSDVETFNVCPLSIIVSHPHSCSKRVTVGEVIKRITQRCGSSSQYTYTAPTCKGSSGALVFILGQGFNLSNHPHSYSASSDLPKSDHVNISGFSFDL